MNSSSHYKDLTNRLDRLGSKLVESESEKNELRQRLDDLENVSRNIEEDKVELETLYNQSLENLERRQKEYELEKSKWKNEKAMLERALKEKGIEYS